MLSRLLGEIEYSEEFLLRMRKLSCNNFPSHHPCYALSVGSNKDVYTAILMAYVKILEYMVSNNINYHETDVWFIKNTLRDIKEGEYCNLNSIEKVMEIINIMPDTSMDLKEVLYTHDMEFIYKQLLRIYQDTLK